jgi:hydroxysqualene dehydroxylase
VSARVAVIGGGYAGFAAAVTLAANRRDVTVFEAARTLGGRARRVEANGVTIDNGQHILLGAYSQTLALLRRVHGEGAEHDLLERRRLRIEASDGFRMVTPPLAAPWNLLAGLLFARGISFRDRLRTVEFVRRLDRGGFQCSVHMTAATLLEDQPRAVVDALWEPLCIATLNTPISVASAEIFLNVLAAAFASRARDSDVLFPRVDLSTLFPDAAAAYVADRGGEIRMGTTIAGVSTIDDCILLTTGYHEERFAAVVVAVGPHQLESLLESAPGAAQALAKVRAFAYEPILTAYLQYGRALPISQPMLKLDGAPGQWLIDRGQLAGPPGLASVMISTERPGTRKTHEVLAREIDTQLRRSLPGLSAPSWIQVISERRATYACIAGLPRPTAGVLAARMYIAGDYTYGEFPATLEAATRSGVAAARALLKESR